MPFEQDGKTTRFLTDFLDIRFTGVGIRFAPGGAHGVSIGKTLPAYPSPQQTVYPRAPFTAQNAAQISCQQVPGKLCRAV